MPTKTMTTALIPWHWQVIADAFRASDSREIESWARDNILVGSWSPWPGTFDASITPWIVEPLHSLRKPGTHRMTLIGPAAGGKSTIAELFLAWLIDNDPGFTCWFSQTDETAKEFAETRILPFLEHCPRVTRLFPGNRFAKRTQSILFPHMSFLVLPANETQAQSKHIRYMICDETWQYAPGILMQLHKRTTKFAHNRKILELSTGSVAGDETDQAFRSGSRREWQFTCPTCSVAHAPAWEDVEWSKEAKRRDGTWDRRKVRESVVYKCPTCLATFKPTEENHWKLNRSGTYTESAGDAAPGHESFHWNAIAADFRLLGELAVEYLDAKDAVKRGTTVLLQEYTQKRLANAWAEEPPRFEVAEQTSTYDMGDPWPEEAVRFLTVDVQQSHFWIVCRGWKQGPESRLHFAGRVETWPEVREAQEALAVENRFTFVDAGHFTDNVYRQCCVYDWNAVKGEAAPTGYTETIGEGPQRRSFRVPMKQSQGRGVPTVVPDGAAVPTCELWMMSEGMTSDSMQLFRSGKSAGWTLPRNTPAEYVSQLAARVKRSRPHPRTNAPIWEWITLGKQGEHCWDCERMQVGAAYLCGILMPKEKEESEQ